MKQHLLMLFTTIAVLNMLFCGCTTFGGDKNKFLGSWDGTYSWAGNYTRNVPATITFYSDGTYLAVLPMIHDNGTWDVTSGKLMKTRGNSSIAYTYTFSKNDTSLLLTSSPADDLWNLMKLNE